jgi:hypothetical protein
MNPPNRPMFWGNRNILLPPLDKGTGATGAEGEDEDWGRVNQGLCNQVNYKPKKCAIAGNIS